jgi:WD40 repeat protein
LVLILLTVSPALQGQQRPVTLALKETGTTLLGFGAFRIALSADGSILATSGMEEGTILLRQMPSGKELRTIAGQKNEVPDLLSFSPKDDLLEARTVNLDDTDLVRTLRFLDVKTGKEVFTLRGAGTLSPDRKTMARVSGQRRVEVLDVATRKPLRQHSWRDQEVLSLSFSRDGKIWVTTNAVDEKGRSTLRLWNTATNRVVLESWFSLIGSVSPDGKRLAAWTGLGACNGGALVLWEFDTRKALALSGGFTENKEQLAFSPDNRWLVAVSAHSKEPDRETEGIAELWAIRSGKRILSMALPGGVHSASFSSDGKLLAVAGEKYCLLQQLAPIASLESSLGLLTFSRDGKTLAVGGVDGSVQLWDVGTGKQLYKLKDLQKQIHEVAFSYDGKTLAAAAADGRIGLWTVRTGRLLHRLKIEGKDRPQPEISMVGEIVIRTPSEMVHDLSFSQDGRILYSSTPTGYRRWHVETGREYPRPE